MATLIQIRRGTSSQWSSANPVLASGELAISTDLEKIKIGDGSSTWSNLLYINLTPAEIQSAIDSSVSSVLDGAPALLDTLNELAAALGDDENFASTITNSLADKLDVSTASSTYLTQANAASSYDAIGLASAAQTAAESYADGLASNYDPAGSSATAQSNAESYSDSSLSTHNADTTNVHGIADTSALATKTYADNAATTAAANLIDSAPLTLDTLNELAAALGDDPNFATTVTNSIATKANDADLTSHESATTNVHGISDTSLLATISYVDSAESDAVTSANSYSDGLSPNYDPSGSSATAEGNANSYTDTEISTHNSDTTSVHGIADTSLLATISYVDTAESDAVSSSNSYADSLASNYDAAGTASSEVSTHNLDTTSVHGISDTSLLATTSYVDTAESDAVSTANTYSDSLASNYDSSGSASAVASDLTDHENATTSVHGIANTADLATKTYADSAADSAESAANSYSDGLAVNYDPAGSAATAESNSNSYTDTAVSNLVDSSPEALNTLNELAAALGDDANFATTVASQIGAKADTTTLNSHTSATTSVHGITNTANLIYTSDSRLSDNRTPTDNSVTSAKIVDGTIVNADINATAAIDPSKISGTAVIDSDSRLTNSRTPTSHKSSHATGGSDVLTPSDIGAAPDTGISPSAIIGTAVVTADSRLSDSRTPTAHAASHASGQADALTLSQSQITDLTTDLSTKAPLASPTLTGTPAAPTAALGTNTIQIATTAFVKAETAALVDSAPGTLDTLNELAAALGDDPNFATTISTSLGQKAPLESPTLTGTPTAPTASAATNTTQIATTAYVKSQGYSTTTGTVTSVNASVPTGLSISGGPITSSGTLAITLAGGYEIPTTANLAAKASLASPTFTGTPTAPTASAGTNSTQIATTAYVDVATSAVQPTIHPMFILGGV